MKITPAIFLIFILGACAASDSYKVFGAIDASNKTISMPGGNAPLVGALKEKLPQLGWTLLDETSSEGRYRIRVVESTSRLLCATGQASVYNLSFTDTKTKKEIIAQAGSSCGNYAADKFIEALNKSASLTP